MVDKVTEHDPLLVAINSARVLVERFRVRTLNMDLIATALRELDDAAELLPRYQEAVEKLERLDRLSAACGDGDLDSPWHPDAMIKFVKAFRGVA